MGQTLDWLDIDQRSLPSVTNSGAVHELSTLSTITQRARFRGALLGFMLAPTAVPILHTEAPTEEQSGLRRHPDSHGISAGIKSITRCFEQIDCFLSADPPSADLPPSQNSHSKTWLDSVPILLRYHNHPNRHRLWQSNTATTAQYRVLSDILERAMSGQPLDQAWLVWRAQQASHIDNVAKNASVSASAKDATTKQHYRWLWHTLKETLRSRKLPIGKAHSRQTATPFAAGASNSLPPHAMARHHDVVIGVTCALATIADGPSAARSYHYGQSVSMAAQKISGEIGWEALLMAGLVSGAIVGHSALPVLWQQPKSPIDVSAPIDVSVGISLADALFRQWAGVLPSSADAQADHHPKNALL